MRPPVLLRAASGPRTGSGHVRRSRAVALALRELGAEPVLVVDDPASAESLGAEGLAVELAGDGASWSTRGARAAWFDGFGDFSPELLRLARARTRTLLVENRTPGRRFADLVCYPALHWRPDGWDAAHPGRVIGGPQWIPLAPEVLAQPAAAERDVDLLVTFGGSDPNAQTERVLGVLAGSGAGGRVVVSVGWHMAARRAAIEALAARLPDARVLEPGVPLAPWMARSRTALTALGTTLYELAWFRTPAWILANHEADHEALAYYGERGPHRPLGHFARVSDEELAGALRAGALPPAAPVVGLGGGAERLALVLLGRLDTKRHVA